MQVTAFCSCSPPARHGVARLGYAVPRAGPNASTLSTGAWNFTTSSSLAPFANVSKSRSSHGLQANFSRNHHSNKITTMDRRPPCVDYSDLQWSWPSWKFNLPIDDLFGNLFDQYNKIDIAIQEPTAFHHDVLEVSLAATTSNEFHALLKQRKEKRLQELRQCWSSVAIGIAADPPLLEGNRNEESIAERWAAFLHFSREFSFDALARYFSLFTHNTRSSSATNHHPAHLDSWTSSHTHRTDSPPVSTPPSSTASQTPSRKRSKGGIGSDIREENRPKTKYITSDGQPADGASTRSRPQSRKRPLESISSHNENEKGIEMKRIKKNKQSRNRAKKANEIVGLQSIRRRYPRLQSATNPPATFKTRDHRPIRHNYHIAARLDSSENDMTRKTS